MATINKTRFNIGEKLRVQIQFIGTGTGGGSHKLTLGTDPQNRDGTELKPASQDVITRMEFHIPFRTEII